MSNNDKLPNLGSLYGKDEELDALIFADQEDKIREDNELNSARKKTRNKKILFSGIGAASVLALSGVFFLANPFGGDQTAGDVKNGTVSTPGGTSGKNEDPAANPNNNANVSNEDDFWMETGRMYPVNLKEWELTPYPRDGESPELASNYIRTIPGVDSTLNNLPSRSSGFTDNPKEVRLPDGSLNPLYSYWTQEGFNEFVGISMVRFVNPIFGEWELYQHPENNDVINTYEYLPHLFEDVFDPEYFDAVRDRPSKEWIPIYADWDANDYGMSDQLLKGGPRWMGVLESLRNEFKYDSKTQSYSATVKGNVTYHAWAKDQTKLTKKGVITFDVKKGPENNRYLISNAKLEMK